MASTDQIFSGSIAIETNIYTKEVINAIKTATRRGMGVVGRNVRDAAKNRVPTNTGTLRQSIKSAIRKNRGGDFFTAIVKTGAGDRGRHYGAVIEYGPNPARKSSRRANYAAWAAKYRARPFMRPALNEVIPQIPQILKEVTAMEALKQAMKHPTVKRP